MDAEGMARATEILRVVTGSELYGTNLEGSSDRDEIGVCIPEPEFVLGFTNFEQFEYSTGKKNERNAPGDLDLTIYSIRKFAKLVTDGNPSMLCLLWVPGDKRISWTPSADRLMDIREHVHSREAAKKFLGYMGNQIKRLSGQQNKHTPNRPELIEEFGFDTKFASHAIRLGLQGIEFLENGKITLPMREQERQLVVDIRKGVYTLEDVIECAKMLEFVLLELRDDSNIPKNPNRKAVEELVIQMQLEYWTRYRLY